MRWHCVPPKPRGAVEVRGTARAIRPVHGILVDGSEGVFVLTVLGTRTWSGTHLVQIVTANDFVLDADDGRSFVVRAADIFLDWGWVGSRNTFPWSTLEPVQRLLPESMQDKIAKTPLRPPAALRFRELAFPAGHRFVIRGLVRQEPAPFGTPGSGFRDQAAVPTLTGGGRRLELRYIAPKLQPRRHAWPGALGKARKLPTSSP